MKTALKIVVLLLLVVVLVGAGAFGWARSKRVSLLTRTIETHRVDFPIPWPLSAEEVEQARAEHAANGSDAALDGAALAALAEERARVRGRHLVEARYVCVECHGADFGGGVMVDDPLIGRLLGPNITTGEGGRTAGYAAADWDRIVRHGVRPDGTPAAMPAEDFQRMSDRELSDIVAYVRAQPPVDSVVPSAALGPLGTMLLATGQLILSADAIAEHDRPHAVEPPPAEVSVAFGRHLAGVCMGCHGAELDGGPIPGGPPDWPPAANLTAHADGLAGWTYEQFASTMRTGLRPDGTELRPPMAGITAYAKRMTDVELEGLWAYLASLPPLPTGN
jgi:mono/diheme cytochrome c family protein